MRKFSLVEFSIDHPKLVVVLSVVLALLFMKQFPKMRRFPAALVDGQTLYGGGHRQDARRIFPIVRFWGWQPLRRSGARLPPSRNDSFNYIQRKQDIPVGFRSTHCVCLSEWKAEIHPKASQTIFETHAPSEILTITRDSNHILVDYKRA